MTNPQNDKKASRGRPKQSQTLVQISIRIRPEDRAWILADRANLQRLRDWLKSQAG